MLPNSSSTRTPTVAGPGPYLELENHLQFRRGEYAIAIGTVLYSRQPESDRPQGLLDRVLSPLRSAIGAVRAWRAKNWVVNYVESNFGGAGKAKDFLQAVRAEGKVRRDDFLCLLLEDKLNPLSSSARRDSSKPAAASLDTVSRDAVLGRLVKEELGRSGFGVAQVNAFMGFMNIGQLSEPDADLLWGFVNKFHESIDSGRGSRVMALLKPKVEQLSQSLAIRDKQIEIRSRTQRSVGVTTSSPSVAGATSRETRKVLSERLQKAWSKAQAESLAGNPKVIDQRREVLLRYLRTGLTGMSPEDLYQLKSYAYYVKHHPTHALPANSGIDTEPELVEQYDAVLAELERIDPFAENKSATQLTKDALVKIIVSSQLSPKYRLCWSDAIKPLMGLLRDGKLPEEEGARQALRQLLDPAVAAFDTVRNAAILDPQELSQLYEVISLLRTALGDEFRQPREAPGQQSVGQ